MTDRVGVVCRALAHPVRRRLLKTLLAGERDVTEMTGACVTDQPTVSKHLAVLRAADLVSVRSDGRRRCYSLAVPELAELLALLDTFEDG